MNWPLLAAAAGALLSCLNLANLFLNNRTRADINELKLWITQERAKDARELRDWVEANFVRKDVFEAQRLARKAS